MVVVRPLEGTWKGKSPTTSTGCSPSNKSPNVRASVRRPSTGSLQKENFQNPYSRAEEQLGGSAPSCAHGWTGNWRSGRRPALRVSKSALGKHRQVKATPGRVPSTRTRSPQQHPSRTAAGGRIFDISDPMSLPSPRSPASALPPLDPCQRIGHRTGTVSLRS